MLHDLNGFPSYRELVLDLNLSVVNKFSFSWLVLYFLRAILCDYFSDTVQVCKLHTHTHPICLSQQLSKAVAVSLCNQQENIDTQRS